MAFHGRQSCHFHLIDFLQVPSAQLIDPRASEIILSSGRPDPRFGQSLEIGQVGLPILEMLNRLN